MTETSPATDTESAMKMVESAVEQKKITASASENIRHWLTQEKYAAYLPELVAAIEAGDWQTLDDVFWTVIPFGTGGRRGKMHPFGSNAINDRTIGESAQGLADYIKETKPDGPWAAGIGYDTRHRSREFAELCAGILVANGFTVYFIDDFRSTPELSYLVRYKNCDGGIMVTASHNPPSDNAVKVYWSNGAQLIPPHDEGVIDCVENVGVFEVADFEQAVNDGKVVMCREEMDAALLERHVENSLGGPRNMKVIFSPLHGVGEFNVRNLFDKLGIDLEIFEPHREPDGDFPNVPGHVSNPENPEVFSAIIERAKESGAELVLASDPDCDRMGAAAPLTLEPGSEWATFNGNQLGALLCDFVLSQLDERGDLTKNSYAVTTLVTTTMINRICEYYRVKCYNENLVGFKWICNLMDVVGPKDFVFGAEESHGYLVGEYCRDKDGAIACLMMSELAAAAKAQGMSVHQKLAHLYRDHGYHAERLITIRMEGSDGMKRMEKMMNLLRDETPWQLGNVEFTSLRDYDSLCRHHPDGSVEAISGPTGDLVILETATKGNYVAIRPSGTEPKIKLYMFGKDDIEELGQLSGVEAEVNEQFDEFEKALRMFADSVN